MSWLRPLFAPEGIAVVGASRDPRKLGAVMLRSLRTFTGPVAGVNPHDPDPAAGRYRSVAAAADAAGGPLDLAVLCMPAAASAQALTDAARGGARAALVCSGGYAEAGGAGAGFQRDLAAAAADAGLALLGPNTSGFLVPRLRLYASFVPGAASIPAGPVAGVAASGGVNHALAYLLAEAGLGVSLAVGLDNAVDVSAPDVLAHLADDEHTRAVALHVESVPDGPALISAVRHLTARKPVAALVVGRSDVTDLAQSHTGALATSWRTARAALQGAVACAGEHEGTPLLLADLAHPDIEDVEIKPLRVTQDGLVALDAVLRTRKERHPMIAPIADGTVPWPEDLARAYTAAGWWHGQALGSEIAAAADARSTATALVDCATRISYASLAARADAVASRLTGELGLERGDRIVVQLPNCWQFVVLTLGCLRAGIVPVMALPAHRRHELAYLCEHSEARALAVPGVLRDFDHQDMAAQLRAGSATLRHILVAGEDVRPGHLALTALCTEPGDPAADRARWDADSPDGRDVAVFLLSGGTTGLPKLIARTHNDYSYNARASAELCRLGQDTVYLGTLPASHNFPLACPGILGTLLSGGRVIMLSSAQPQAVFPAVEREGVTMAAVVPAIAQRWLAYAEEHGAAQLRTLRVLQVGGARLADELARRVRPVLGATLQQVFGMAEGLLNYTRLDDPEEVICSTQGRPLSPGDEVRIVDGAGDDLPDGVAGLLLTRGPYTPCGYYRAPEQNARAFTPDGWYASGDVVRRRPDGNLIVEGRDKDMINRGGEKISAEEVENLVYRLPGIAQVAAVAAPDADLGERVCVFVVPQAGADITLAVIRDGMAAAGVARFKWPERLEIAAELPTTKVGKLDKKALREMLTPAPPPLTRP